MSGVNRRDGVNRRGVNGRSIIIDPQSSRISNETFILLTSIKEYKPSMIHFYNFQLTVSFRELGSTILATEFWHLFVLKSVVLKYI